MDVDGSERVYENARPGFPVEKKETILKLYFWPKALKKYGLAENHFVLEDEMCRLLVRDYAGDSGIRELDRAVERLFTDYCRRYLTAGRDCRRQITVSAIRHLLGPGRTPRRLPVKTGEVYGVCQVSGTVRLCLIEASVTEGTGQFRLIGTATPRQAAYVEAAYECVRNATPIDVSALNVTVFSDFPPSESMPNSIGSAVFAAICFAATGTAPMPNVVFCGGIGLNGSLYDEFDDLRPLARALAQHDIQMLYGPPGIGSRLALTSGTPDGLYAVEAADAYDLISTTVEFERNC